jgi:hypothetical protein
VPSVTSKSFCTHSATKDSHSWLVDVNAYLTIGVLACFALLFRVISPGDARVILVYGAVYGFIRVGRLGLT